MILKFNAICNFSPCTLDSTPENQIYDKENIKF